MTEGRGSAVDEVEVACFWGYAMVYRSAHGID